MTISDDQSAGVEMQYRRLSVLHFAVVFAIQVVAVLPGEPYSPCWLDVQLPRFEQLFVASAPAVVIMVQTALVVVAKVFW
jgi:hypothetical protein